MGALAYSNNNCCNDTFTNVQFTITLLLASLLVTFSQSYAIKQKWVFVFRKKTCLLTELRHFFRLKHLTEKVTAVASLTRIRVVVENKDRALIF